MFILNFFAMVQEVWKQSKAVVIWMLKWGGIITFTVLIGAIVKGFFNSWMAVISFMLLLAFSLQIIGMGIKSWTRNTEINAFRKELRFKTWPLGPFKKNSWKKIEDIGVATDTIYVALKNGKVHSLKTPKAQIIHAHLQQYLAA